MPKGYSPVRVEKVGAYKWMLLTQFHTPHCLVPTRFLTDGASVPRLFWAFINPAGRFFEAAIVHDYMLKNAAYRHQAHDIFYTTAIDYGAKPWVAYIAYQLVRAWDFFN